MSHQIEKKEKFALITLKEEKLNSNAAPLLKSDIAKLNAEGYRNIIMDFNNVKYCDSSGLSVILIGNRTCNNSNGSYILYGVGDQVMKLIKISQLDSILNITPTYSEAEDLLFMEEVERNLDDEEE